MVCPSGSGACMIIDNGDYLMIKLQGAVIKEQGVTFAITVVKRYILNSQIQCQQAVQSFQPLFPGMPIVLMGQDTRRTPTYWGGRTL